MQTKKAPVMIDTLKKSGIGLRHPHMQELLLGQSSVGFLEAHSENYFGGGLAREQLIKISKMYPVTLHGVGLSLGRADGLDKNHLRQLKALIDEVNPVFVSEHLTWSGYSHTHVPDLLPLPFTNEALDTFVDHVKEFQDTVGRQILVENPSNYLAFKDLDFTETEFLNLVAERSGCGLLLDINNIVVSAQNLGYSPEDYVDEMTDSGAVKQFHLAGYEVRDLENGAQLYLDTHGHSVYPEVWELYKRALRRFGDIPTLIEWDMDIPALSVLEKEAAQADGVRAEIKREHSHVAAS